MSIHNIPKGCKISKYLRIFLKEFTICLSTTTDCQSVFVLAFNSEKNAQGSNFFRSLVKERNGPTEKTAPITTY